MRGMLRDLENETLPVALGCLHKHVDDLLKLF